MSKIIVNVFQKKDTLKWAVEVISQSQDVSATFECDEKPEVMVEEKEGEDALEVATQRGINAYHYQQSRSSNPYPIGSKEEAAWDAAFVTGHNNCRS